MPTFWYNCANESKGAKFGTDEADIIWIKNGNFHVCGRISICPFHTYIHILFVEAGQCVAKKLKADVDLPN